MNNHSIIRFVINIMCLAYFMTSLTMSDPQSSDMRHIR